MNTDNPDTAASAVAPTDTVADDDSVRIGHGYDIHRLSADESDGAGIRLAGVDIRCPMRIEAHSDGDVIVHALIDAILGALALGDLGEHFPDNDPVNRNRNSLHMLEQIYTGHLQARWRVSNADITLIAEWPRIGVHRSSMRSSLARALRVREECMSVKATTHEGLDSLGSGAAIAAHAVVLVRKSV